ncbi:DUF2946 family protein [Burkholderia diffusa]|uniref:DUF2946 family protein n=1 Tax=Burkholderia diffusa TaxID=488732 RepID=UPI00075B8DFA|nr:DUF2946 family protein [Burkholderia diffusa]KVM97870.1 hypothetical protein WJ62_20155 [Burkholderia diffusa]
MRRARRPDSVRAGAQSTPTRQARATAWLGLLALVLALVSPVVSQLHAGAQNPGLPVAVICSATGVVSVAHADPHTPSGSHLDRCGYCGFLAGHPPLQYAVHFPDSPAVQHVLHEPPIPLGRRPAARYALAARGPPLARS